jgi:cutinase
MVADSKVKGAADVVKRIIAQAAQCPNQKYVLVGYSQGADVQHEAAQQIPKQLHSRIVALVMFGDPGNKGPTAQSPLGGLVPMFPAGLEQKTKQNCASGDPVCSSGANILMHLVYGTGNYMSSSAAYIKKQLDSNGAAGPEKATG